MASAGTVTVDFAAETAKFTAELKQVNARLKDMETGFGGMATAAKTAFSLISVGVLTNFAKQAWNAADAIGDMSSRLGVSVESLSRLKYAAEQNDVSFESLSNGVKNLQKSLSETDPVFSKLGLSAQALKELSLEQQFATLADAFRNVQSPADQTRVAMQLFGKAGVDLVPLLNQGAEGIAELTRRADELGLTLDGKTAAAIDLTDKKLKELRETLNSYTAKGIANVVIGVETVAEGLAKLIHGSDTVEGRLTDQLNSLLSQRSGLLQQIRTDEQALENSGAIAGRTLKIYIEANKRDLAEVEAQVNKINDQLLGIDQERSRAAVVAKPVAAPASDGLEEFTSPLLQSQLTGGAQQAAEASAAITEIFAEANQQRIEDDIKARQESIAEDLRLQQEAAADRLSIESEMHTTLRSLESETASVTAQLARSTLAELEKSAAERKAIEQSVVSSGIQALNAWNQASTTKSKELVAINKAVSIAQALQNTYVGATKAIAQGGIFGYASAAAIVAFGLAQVAAIARTNYGSSGNASIASGTSVNPVYTTSTSSDSDTEGATQQSATQIIINGDVLGGDAAKQWIIDTISEAVNDRDVVIISGDSRQAAELVPA